MDQLHGKGAKISEDEMYRYLLWRIWDEPLPRLLWVLLNPSTADAETDDRTVRRCKCYSRDWKRLGSEWQYGGLEIVNLFTYRATSRDELKKARNPVGPENDRYIIAAAQRATHVVVAWGEDGAYLGRDQQVLQLLIHYAPQPLHCLVKNRDGSPHHPLRLPVDIVPIPYT